MEEQTAPESFYAASRSKWRAWLKKNHGKKKSIWLIYYKKQTGKPSLSWSDAVDEALCFGWIDSTRRSLDHERFTQLFTPRKPKSNWSKINKAKTELLIRQGLMMPAGLGAIAVAKKNGSWTKADEVEEVTTPKDLLAAFRKHPGSRKFFESLSRSVKKTILHWILSAKRPDTRERRIAETAYLAARNQRPKQFGG